MMAKFIFKNPFVSTHQHKKDYPKCISFGHGYMANRNIYWNGYALETPLHTQIAKIESEAARRKDTWILTRDDFEECCKLFGLEFQIFPPAKYVQARELLFRNSKDESFRLKQIYYEADQYIPKKIFWTELVKFCKQVSDELDKADLQYWNNFARPSIFFLNMLERAALNGEEFIRRLQDPNTTNVHQLVSMLAPIEIKREPLRGEIHVATLPKGPNQQESLKKLIENLVGQDFSQASSRAWWTRNNTVTGRATITEGFPWLTLNKEYRQCIASSRPDKAFSKIFALDYASLEPRILLVLSQILKSESPSPPLIGSLPRHSLAHTQVPDVYLKVLEDLGLSDKLPRDIAKQTILSIVYGQSEEVTAEKLKGIISKPEDFVAAVQDYFGVPALRQALSRDLMYSNRKTIKSYYGRPILCEGVRPSKLTNYFIQATAVDAALSGFRKIVKHINRFFKDDKLLVKPIGYVHDSLIIDVSADSESLADEAISELEDIGSTEIEGFEGINFYLRRQDFHRQALATSSSSQEDEGLEMEGSSDEASIKSP